MSKATYEFQPRAPAVIPEGTPVWIGDPCYVLEPWDLFCGILFDSEETTHSSVLWLEIEPQTYHEKIRREELCNRMVSWNTAYGDGGYELRRNGTEIGNCGVDAGLLAIIPLECLRSDRAYLERMGVITTAPNGAIHLEDGDLLWGDLSLYTSDNDPSREPTDEGDSDD